MVTRRRVRTILNTIALYTIAVLLIGYFGVNAYTGARGLRAIRLRASAEWIGIGFVFVEPKAPEALAKSPRFPGAEVVVRNAGQRVVDQEIKFKCQAWRGKLGRRVGCHAPTVLSLPPAQARISFVQTT